MADDGSFAYQLSVKLPGRVPGGYADDMLNIRAADAIEFKLLLDEFLDTPSDTLAESIVNVVTNLKAAATVAQGLAVPATTPAGGPVVNAAAPAGAPATEGADPIPDPLKPAFEGKARTCAHGARVLVRPASGAWAGLMCPLPQARKAEQCSPEFADKKKLPKA